MMQILTILSISLYFIASALGQTPAAPSARLQASVRSIVQAVDAIGPGRESLEKGLTDLLTRIPQLRVDLFPVSEYAGARRQLVPQLFYRRMALRQRLVELERTHELTEATARRVMTAMRYLRGIEDYLGYVDSDRKATEFAPKPGIRYLLPGSVKTLPAQSLLPARYTLVNPSYVARYRADAGELNLRSGDLLLSRGSAATSSAIARLADDDTQFSHVGIVYVDPRTRQAYTIEAHIELGVVTTPIEKWFTDGKRRTAVFRYADAAVAERAGALIHEHVARYQREHGGENIPYDFGFNMYDRSQIFCSEVVRVAYALATGESVQVPRFPARLTPKNRGFLDQLGIKQTESFIPADLDIDPRFELVAEWRDYGALRESWVSDAITSKVYEWMERDGLKYDAPLLLEAAGGTLTWLRKNKFQPVEKRLAPNATKETVAVMLTIVRMYSKVHKELLKMESRQLAARGTPYTFFEALNALEALRKEKPSLFSRYLK